MRLFVALPIQERAAAELKDWVSRHRQTLAFRKWTHPLDYHITLQFLGETSEAQAEQLQAALSGVRAQPFELELAGGGVFGQPSAPRVLWSGVRGDSERLASLHHTVVQATKPLGFVPEERPYAPHITLARQFIGKAGSMPGDITSTMPAGYRWEANRFVLMRTNMHNSPMYETIGEYSIPYYA